MSSKNFKSYKRLVSILKKICPLAYPVSVRRIKMKNFDGDCSLSSKKFYIRINSTLQEPTAIDTLLHEWAHARAWNHLHDKLSWEEFEQRSHDASWGVAYSEVYMIYEQNFFTKADTPITKCVKMKIK